MNTVRRGLLYSMAFDQFRAVYNAGKAGGLVHIELSDRSQAENERRCAAGRLPEKATESPKVWVYWSGYFDGMTIAAGLPSNPEETD